MCQRTDVERIQPWVRFFLLLIAFLPLSCSGNGTVRGKVTKGNTTALTSGIVIFTGNDGVPFSGAINKNGDYEIPNITPGEKTITLVNALMDYGTEPVKDPAVKPTVPKILPIPKKYATPSNGFKYTVKPGSQIFDIDPQP